jgi:hypothetical protein
MSVPVDSYGTTWRAGTPTKVLEGGCYFGGGSNPGRTYDVSPDGRRFLMVKSAGDQGAQSQIVVVKHWFEVCGRSIASTHRRCYRRRLHRRGWHDARTSRVESVRW